MITQAFDTFVPVLEGDLAGPLVHSYQAQEDLFRAQTPQVQRMLELHARLVAKALVDHSSPIRFTLPDQVMCKFDGKAEWFMLFVPADHREQKVGGLFDYLRSTQLDQRLSELEGSFDLSISTSAKLMRHAIAKHLTYRIIPVAQQTGTQQSIPAYALGFFLPQWVAFDEQDNLLVNSMDEARVSIDRLQQCLSVLKKAEGLAPYMLADGEYRRKRNGILAQLIHQGRALARHETSQIINTIRRRAAANTLNRGLSLSLPYFDDQELKIKIYEFEIIPTGRIQFAPAFVTVACEVEQIKVSHETNLSSSTRKHLLLALRTIAAAFENKSLSISKF